MSYNPGADAKRRRGMVVTSTLKPTFSIPSTYAYTKAYQLLKGLGFSVDIEENTWTTDPRWQIETSESIATKVVFKENPDIFINVGTPEFTFSPTLQSAISLIFPDAVISITTSA